MIQHPLLHALTTAFGSHTNACIEIQIQDFEYWCDSLKIAVSGQSVYEMVLYHSLCFVCANCWFCGKNCTSLYGMNKMEN